MIDGLRHPYPGLRAFTRDDSDLFFGREGCVDQMVDRLGANRFLAVLGPSGSGKSSLVRTGLFDALELGLLSAAGSHWVIADAHPGGQPIRQLACALLQATAGRSADVDLMTSFLRKGRRSVAEWAAGGNIAPGTNLLILVDQFEELFRYADYAQREEAEAFVAMLLESSTTRIASIYLVITMRSEYLGACASIEGLAERISGGLYLTPRMDREQCREAIEGPASVMGFQVEPALVTRILNDLANFAPWDVGEEGDLASQLARQADQLPLMQHVLNRLWLRAETEADGKPVVLRLSEYDTLGGLGGALDAHGAEVIATLSPSTQSKVECVFRALVAGNSLATAVRRPCRMSELVEVADGAADDVREIVNSFRSSDCNFLRTSEPNLTSDQVIVDISHESLIRQWTPLRQWMEQEARDGATWRRLISAEERYTRGEGGLLTGLDYQTTADWWDHTRPNPAWSSRNGGGFEQAQAFLETSRETEEARTAIERQIQARRKRQLVAGIIALASVLIVVSGLGITAKIEANRAGKAKIQADQAKNEAEQAKHQSDLERKVSEAQTQELREQKVQLIRAEERAERSLQGEKAQAKQLATALDDVSHVINSDRNSHLVGVENLRAQLMQAIRHYQGAIDQQHKDMIQKPAEARDEYQTAMSLAAIGQGREALEVLKQGFNDSLNAIRSVPNGQSPPELLEADFLEDGYQYVWMLLDTGENDTAAQVLGIMKITAATIPSTATTSRLLVALARWESLQDRFEDDGGNPESSLEHARKAVSLAQSAAERQEADLDTTNFLIRAYLNLARHMKGNDKDELSAKACKIASDLYSNHADDKRAIVLQLECIDDEGDAAARNGQRDVAVQRYAAAEGIAERALKIEPTDQALLLQMTGLENDLGYLFEEKGQEDQLFRHRMSAQAYFVQAIANRPVYQTSTTQLKGLYLGIRAVDFKEDTAELTYYKQIVSALSSTLNAFPKAPSYAFIAADASTRMGKILRKKPGDEGEAEKYLSSSIDWFTQSGIAKNISTFTEDFEAFCSAYESRLEIYADTSRLDLMLGDVKQMNAICRPMLEKYDWDIYLRGSLIDGSAAAGKALMDAARYSEALPLLEYASKWGNKKSTRLMARMYREGLQVPKNEQKAIELDDLAAGQIVTSFTVPIDFSGTKVQAQIFIRDWPPEYKYEAVDDQVIWWKQARSGTLSPEMLEGFRKLLKIAHDNKIPFRELTEYAFNINDTQKVNENLKNHPNDKAKAELERSVSLAKENNWPDAAQAAEHALELDTDSVAILRFASNIYHEKTFKFDRAFELDSSRLLYGDGIRDFAEAHLSTHRFEACTGWTNMLLDGEPDQSNRVAMAALQFACASAAHTAQQVSTAGTRLRKELKGYSKTSWSFAGTEHFVATDPAFTAKASQWAALFKALEQGDAGKANLALSELGVAN